MTEATQKLISDLVQAIAQQVQQARDQVRQAVNSAMVQSYWEIGRLIVEHEQQGDSRAAYGKQQLQQLSEQLTQRLDKGFDVTNLRNMRRFYQLYPIRDAVRLELSWTHYLDFMNLQDKACQESKLGSERPEAMVRLARGVGDE